jgi:hypothetical protein
MKRLTADDLADGCGRIVLDENGRATEPWALVDLDHTPSSRATLAAAVNVARGSTQILIGVTDAVTCPETVLLAEELAFSLTPETISGVPKQFVSVADVSTALGMCATSMDRCPTTALTFVDLLGLTSRLPVREGLIAESLAYSMLLAGSEFTRWLDSRPDRKQRQQHPHDPVILRRDGTHLFIELNRPERHNAFGRDVRDALIEAFRLAQLDSSIHTVHLGGSGPSFCSGGDLDEFGNAGDVCVAHLVRQNQNAGLILHDLNQQVHVVVHGACIGAGVELPAFASHVQAHDDAYFQLPEIQMGLIPGAGGTVSITRRIGRWRTAYLGLSGQPINVDTALSWGLVDARASKCTGTPPVGEVRPSRSSSSAPIEIGLG